MHKFHQHDLLYLPGPAIFTPKNVRVLQSEVKTFTQALAQVHYDSVAGYEELQIAGAIVEDAFVTFIKDTMRRISDLYREDGPIPYPSVDDFQLLADLRKQAQTIGEPGRPLVLCARENRIDNDLIKKIYALHVEQHALVARCFDSVSLAGEARDMRDMGSVIENAASIFVPTRSMGTPGSSAPKPGPTV